MRHHCGTRPPLSKLPAREQDEVHEDATRKGRGGKWGQGQYFIFPVITILNELSKNPGRIPEVV